MSEEQATTMIDVNTNIEPEATTDVSAEVVPDEVKDTSEVTPEQVDYLYAGKFKTAEALETGYKELMTKFTEKRPTAPDEYNFDFSEHETLKNHQINLDDDPTYQAMVPLFKEMNLSQEQASTLMNTYMESIYSEIPDIGEEMKKLGPNANEMLDRVNKFVAKEVPEKFRPLIEQAGATAVGVEFVEWVQNGMMRDGPIPTDADAYAPRKSYQEVMAEAMELRKGTPNFEIDKKAQARYEALMDQAVKLQVGANT